MAIAVARAGTVRSGMSMASPPRVSTKVASTPDVAAEPERHERDQAEDDGGEAERPAAGRRSSSLVTSSVGSGRAPAPVGRRRRWADGRERHHAPQLVVKAGSVPPAVRTR